MRLLFASTLLLLAPSAFANSPPGGGHPGHGGSSFDADGLKAAKEISKVDLMKNLKQLDNIAAANGGNRAFGLPGYRASVDFITKELKPFKNFIDVKEQEFEALFAFVDEIQFNEVGKEDSPYYVFGLTYSPSTTEEGITAELALGPADESGCDAAGYSGQDVKDKVVLVQRFRCPDGTTLGGRVRAAVAAGASAVLIYNNVESLPTAGTLSAPDPVGYRPAGFIKQSDGEALAARITSGETINVFFKQLQTIETRKSWNVIAETKAGDANSVVVSGAHLDSVQAGAGINDDGSGTTTILEVLTAVKKFKFGKNDSKLRFCWWGGEENGLLGSEHYVNTMEPKELAKIRAYLNYDMVGRGFYGVFDGDGSAFGLAGAAGSDAIEKLFTEYLSKEQKVTITETELDGGSDYVPFMEKGIPIGGLFTGVGVEQDPCYHQECDGYENVNPETLTKNAKAAAYVAVKLAKDAKKLIPQWTPLKNKKREEAKIHWTHSETGKHRCGGDVDA